MIRFASSTQGVCVEETIGGVMIMIRHPLHRGCNDQASSTQGVS